MQLTQVSRELQIEENFLLGLPLEHKNGTSSRTKQEQAKGTEAVV